MNRQKANFQLKTNEGVTNTANNNCTWNVDISKVLGELWDKYDYFNLTLKCIAWDILPAGVNNGSQTNQLNSYFMRGLQWENCNYDTRLNLIEDKSCIGTVYIRTPTLGAAASYNYYNPINVINTFRKSRPVVDLNISVINILNNTPGLLGTAGSQAFPHTIYDFSITPCQDYSETTALLTLYEPVLTNNGSTQTFKDINFELALGQLYKQYTTFSLELVDLQSAPFATLVVNSNSICPNIELLGLQPIDKSNNNSIILNSCYLDTNAGRGYIQYNSTNNFLLYVDEVDSHSVVKLNAKNDLVINFKSIETKNLITITSGSIRKCVFQLLIKPIK